MVSLTRLGGTAMLLSLAFPAAFVLRGDVAFFAAPFFLGDRVCLGLAVAGIMQPKRSSAGYAGERAGGICFPTLPPLQCAWDRRD